MSEILQAVSSLFLSGGHVDIHRIVAFVCLTLGLKLVHVYYKRIKEDIDTIKMQEIGRQSFMKGLEKLNNDVIELKTKVSSIEKAQEHRDEVCERRHEK